MREISKLDSDNYLNLITMFNKLGIETFLILQNEISTVNGEDIEIKRYIDNISEEFNGPI